MLPAFFRWADSQELGSCLEFVKHNERLFPQAIRLLGWGHSWGNIMKTVAHSCKAWPQLELRLRAQVKFWKNASWREHVQKCLARTAPEVDTSVLDHFSVDMAKWRYQTIAEVAWYLARLRHIAENHVREEWFQNTQERQIIHDFMEGCRDSGFWKFVTASEREIWSKAEKERRWGMICDCPEHLQARAQGVRHITCVLNSRRLAETAQEIDKFATCTRARAVTLTEHDCDDDHAVFRIIRPMLTKLAATSVQRFKYIKNTPWSFSQTCTVTGAQDWIDQVLARPLAEHDDLTVYLWGTIEQDVRSVANGGDLTAQHDDAIIKMHLSPWDEGVGEGYHGVTTMEKKRAPGSGTARLKQKARE